MVIDPHLVTGAVIGAVTAVPAEIVWAHRTSRWKPELARFEFLRKRNGFLGIPRRVEFDLKSLILMSAIMFLGSLVAFQSHFFADSFRHTEYVDMTWLQYWAMWVPLALVTFSLVMHLTSPAFKWSGIGRACVALGIVCSALPDAILYVGMASRELFGTMPPWLAWFVDFHHSFHVKQPSYGIWNQEAVTIAGMFVFCWINRRRLALASRRFSFE